VVVSKAALTYTRGNPLIVRDAAARDTHTGKLSMEDSNPLNQEVPASILSNSIDILVCIEFSTKVSSPLIPCATSVSLNPFAPELPILGGEWYLLVRNLGYALKAIILIASF
jgi:hypothetical protein